MEHEIFYNYESAMIKIANLLAERKAFSVKFETEYDLFDNDFIPTVRHLIIIRWD